MTNLLTPTPTPYLEKLTKDILFKKSRIRKHATNFKTSSPPFCVDVINVWSLTGNNLKKESDGEIRDFKG